MSDLPLIVTAAGRAALVNAQHSGTAPVTIASVGVSPTAITATTATAALPGEVKRIAAISGDVVAPDTIHLIVRDDSDQIYTVRSFALYLGDGTLFAAYGQPGIIIEKSALSLLLLALDVRFVDVAATSITFGNTNFLNPPATETVDGVMRLATPAEAAAGVAGRVLTPQRAKAALLSWLGFMPANRAGETFTGPIARDAQFIIDLFSGSPTINLSANRYIQHNRGTDALTVAGGGHTLVLTPTGLTLDGNPVWHAGNDGAGSGSDADLLDGQQGSWYADILGRLGFTPANRAGDTFTGPIARSPNFYLDFVNGNPLLNFDANDYQTYDRQNDAHEFRIAGQSRLRITSAVVTIGGQTVWHAGNDGAGSGMDTDLFQGLGPSYFTDIIARLGYRPANRAGDIFTGPIARDAQFVMDLFGGEPTINFAANRYIQYSRVSDALGIAAGGHTLALSPGGFALNGNPVWHAGNDGAGSGLDADLFHGRSANYYTDITARLGYSPANRAGDNFTGPVQVVQTGSASISVNAFGAVVGRLAAQGDGNVVLYRNDGGGEVPVFGVASRTGPFAVQMPITRSGNAVWDAGNDGAGSGSDADMLDGRHATDFALQADLDRIEVNDSRTPGTDTVQVPAWARRMEVHIVGGGGGGAGGNDSFSGGGGGAGGYVFGTVNVTPGAVLTRVVGVGGAGGGAAGGTGGISSIVSIGDAAGGLGGIANTETCAGGAGGSASGVYGLRAFHGGVGGDGNSFNSKIQGGNGAAGPFGGAGRTGSGGGIPGQAPGAGGGGVWNTSSGVGGAGAAGAVFIRWLP